MSAVARCREQIEITIVIRINDFISNSSYSLPYNSNGARFGEFGIGSANYPPY